MKWEEKNLDLFWVITLQLEGHERRPAEGGPTRAAANQRTEWDLSYTGKLENKRSLEKKVFLHFWVI